MNDKTQVEFVIDQLQIHITKLTKSKNKYKTKYKKVLKDCRKQSKEAQKYFEMALEANTKLNKIEDMLKEVGVQP